MRGVRILCRWPLSGDTVLVFTRHIILLTKRYLHVTKPKLEDRCQYPTFHLINQFNMVFIFVLTGMCWIHKRSLWQNTIANVSINSLYIDSSRNWYTSHVRALSKISITWWWVVIGDINNKKKIWFAVKMIKNVNFQLIVLNSLRKVCYLYSSSWKDESELCWSRPRRQTQWRAITL